MRSAQPGDTMKARYIYDACTAATQEYLADSLFPVLVHTAAVMSTWKRKRERAIYLVDDTRGIKCLVITRR